MEPQPSFQRSHPTHMPHVQEIATDKNFSIDDQDIIDTICTVIFNTGIFYGYCYEWNDKAKNKNMDQLPSTLCGITTQGQMPLEGHVEIRWISRIRRNRKEPTRTGK